MDGIPLSVLPDASTPTNNTHVEGLDDTPKSREGYVHENPRNTLSESNHLAVLGDRSRMFIRKRGPSEHEESQELLQNGTARTGDFPTQSTVPTSNVVHPRHPIHHTPIAATTVFARKAPPLHLPNLDKFLASMSPPDLPFPGDGKKRGERMFPPMNRLADSGRTLEDLETNVVAIPLWKNRRTILGGLVDIVIGLTGSGMLSTYYRLQGLSNTVQIFALILTTIVPLGENTSEKWRKLFLGKIPNVIALNFQTSIFGSLVVLMVLMGIAAAFLWYFYRATAHCDRYHAVEGLEVVSHGSKWGLVIVTFILTVLYLPLSTLAVHILVWSEDLWVVPNPYINATSNPPILPPLGPPDQFRDPLDFCWTTSMKRNEVNFAPVVMVVSVVVISSLTVFFPLALRKVIKQAVPRVDLFTELGRRRTKGDMDLEYQRLLARDETPFAFLYNGYRRGWGTFQATYLLTKLSTLMIIAVVDPNNCLFLAVSRNNLSLIRQTLLLASTIAFFFLQCFLVPFLDPVNNASEWTSRLNCLAVAAVALGVVANVPGKYILNGPILYIIYVTTYSLTVYFFLINLGIVHRFVKRLTRRIDFSIDIFSPRLDLSPSSPHAKRRIWQESITTLLLTSTECEIPDNQPMSFAEARDSEYPPYLLNFRGTPGERHVENLKILREIGSTAYNKGLALVFGPDYAWFRSLEETIQKNFVGPDCYWRSPTDNPNGTYAQSFGNAWWIPFPPTLVLRYDAGSLAVLRDVSDFRSYITQNSTHEVQKRRRVRISLRALEGQLVLWPYEHIQPVGAVSSWWFGRRQYTAQRSTSFRKAQLRIHRRGHLCWEGMQLGSGFEIQLAYAKNVVVAGSMLGLNDNYDLTPPLARFLALNEELIHAQLEATETALGNYRTHHYEDCRRKAQVLSYRFLSSAYDQPQDSKSFAKTCVESERDVRVRRLMMGNEDAMQVTFERLSVITRSEASTWWYLLWDDLWRRNHTTIKALRAYYSDFNPHYPTCIAYTPLPRAALEAFLIQRGLMSKIPQWSDVFHSGFLNKIYLRLNEAAFHGSSRAIVFHLGDYAPELDMEDVDILTQGGPSTLGTGGGTDHDDASIRARRIYHWEGLLDDPWRKGRHGKPNWLARLGVWMGWTPLWPSSSPSDGVALDVQLVNGRFMLMGDRTSSINRTNATYSSTI